MQKLLRPTGRHKAPPKQAADKALAPKIDDPPKKWKWVGPPQGDRPAVCVTPKDLRNDYRITVSDTTLKRWERSGRWPKREKIGEGERARIHWKQHNVNDCVAGLGHGEPDDDEPPLASKTSL
jgi:hypothetical protein